MYVYLYDLKIVKVERSMMWLRAGRSVGRELTEEIIDLILTIDYVHVYQMYAFMHMYMHV